MKRILSFILCLLLLFSFAYAEENEAEEIAHTVFNNLANIYDSTLYFLNQQQQTWKDLIAFGDSQDYAEWFKNSFLLDEERFTAVAFFRSMNADIFPDATGNVSSYYYKHLFEPFLIVYSKTKDGLSAAAFDFTRMIFQNDEAINMLNNQKQTIKDLKSAYPDYEYLADLQDMYRKTSVMLDYSLEATDTYQIMVTRISDYEQTRREIKSIFDFVFDWPTYTLSPKLVPELYRKMYETSEANIQQKVDAETAKAQENEKLYNEAVDLEEQGDYREALVIYEKIGNYKDSKTRAEVCRENLKPYDAALKYGISLNTSVTHKEEGKGIVTKIYFMSNVAGVNGDVLVIDVEFNNETLSFALPHVIDSGYLKVNK